jgi:hypothetical protein
MLAALAAAAIIGVVCLVKILNRIDALLKSAKQSEFWGKRTVELLCEIVNEQDRQRRLEDVRADARIRAQEYAEERAANPGAFWDD